ncbi:MAG: tetratricopeptide repeat protein, partial [Chlamydiota bacterium]|nr:tetratricopeptide repeat protein [Chlamydiota bacterium]
MGHKLSKADINYIKSNFRQKSNRQMADELSVDKKIINQALQQCGLKRTKEDELRLRTSSIQPKIQSEAPESTIEQFNQNTREYHLLVFIFLFTVTFLLYANSFKNQFVWDDEILVVKNNYIKSWDHTPDYFIKNTFKGGDRDSNFWRPTQLYSYLIDFKLWGLQPFGFHLSNTIFHALAGFLIYLYLFVLFRRQVLALIVSLIWIIHPLQTEAVTYIAGRADSIAAIFIFLSLYLYLRYTQSEEKNDIILYLGSFIAFLMAIMSKEMAIMIPFIMILSDVFNTHEKRSWSNRIIGYIPFIVVFLIYWWARKTVLDFATIPILQEQAANHIPTVMRLLTFLLTLSRYLILLFFPFMLHMERGTPYAYNFALSFSLWPYALLFLIVSILSVYAIYLLRKQNDRAQHIIHSALIYSRYLLLGLLLINIRLEIFVKPFISQWTYFFAFVAALILFLNVIFLYRDDKISAFGLLFFFVTIFPFSDIVPLNANMAEHWLYLPCIGIILPVSQWAYNKLKLTSRLDFVESISKIFFSFLIIPILLFSVRTVLRNIDWKDDFTIWRETAAFSDSSHIHGNLGVAYGRRNDFNHAKEEFMRALQLQFNYPEAHNNLGVILLMEGKTDEAIREFKFAIQLNPNYSNAYKKL